ncbi:MAG TPA: plastocyanin/azurin family copper-binding protein [Fimbriimonadaceae bacterium]|nr:plastocyanin/azurin family copper-binding protein [Fimbriimonadaceae bacterium]
MLSSHTFSPVNVTVNAGSTVQWTNTDTTHHTVASDTGVTGLNSDSQYPTGLPGGSSFSWLVPSNAVSGTVYYYHCEFHGAAGNGSSLGQGMAGSITIH